MLVYKSKKVVFYNDKLIVRNKYEITYKDIENCWYTYRTVKSTLRSMGFPGNTVLNVIPGWLMIHLSKNRKNLSDKGFYKRDRGCYIKIKPEAINKLPKSLFNRIRFNERFMEPLSKN